MPLCEPHCLQMEVLEVPLTLYGRTDGQAHSLIDFRY